VFSHQGCPWSPFIFHANSTVYEQFKRICCCVAQPWPVIIIGALYAHAYRGCNVKVQHKPKFMIIRANSGYQALFFPPTRAWVRGYQHDMVVGILVWHPDVWLWSYHHTPSTSSQQDMVGPHPDVWLCLWSYYHTPSTSSQHDMVGLILICGRGIDSTSSPHYSTPLYAVWDSPWCDCILGGYLWHVSTLNYSPECSQTHWRNVYMVRGSVHSSYHY